MAAETPKHTNRLSAETSPYLLQHQHNPVDWYAWGDEAFAAARRENKPIFLSVGYSTCYWCHVMERQSFENESIAEEMNRRFINIKVDREERPDVDQLYMTAVQVLTRHGGWPMSVFLLPDLRPFYGGTYFPPTDQHGRPGFPTLIRALEDAYRNRAADVGQSADQIVNILKQLAEPNAPSTPIRVDADFIDTIVRRSISDYDAQNGGFGSAPKFPRQTLLELLLNYLAGPANHPNSPIPNPKANDDLKSLLTHTLDSLANGGIRDQLGGGFHRYSTDAQWLVPHFEIMLYDNAMLAWCYVEAFRQTRDARYAAVARDIFDFVLREMTSPQGGFYTAFDAEVDAQEGLTYLWTRAEVEATLAKALGEDPAAEEKIARFCRVYGLDEGPNFADPHHGSGRPDKNILYLAEPGHGPQSALLDPELKALRQILYAERRQRKQPMLDTKIITSWNALMIRAFAFGGQILGESAYANAARAAADFLLATHMRPEGSLYRTSRDGVSKHAAFLDDYAFLTQAMLTLHTCTGDDRWNDEARKLAREMTQKFADPGAGGFFFTESGATDLIVRQKVASDSPLPSGNAIAAMCLLALGDIEGARNTIALFAEQLSGNGEGMSSLVQAAMMYLQRNAPFMVSADGSSSDVDRPLPPDQIAQAVVTMRGEWASPQLFNLRVSILDGFHINAHEAAAGLVATQLSVTGPSGALVAAIDYPAGEEHNLEFSQEPLHTYRGEITIAIQFKSPPTANSKLLLALRYQACNDNACLPPITKLLEADAFQS